MNNEAFCRYFFIKIYLQNWLTAVKALLPCTESLRGVYIRYSKTSQGWLIVLPTESESSKIHCFNIPGLCFG